MTMDGSRVRFAMLLVAGVGACSHDCRKADDTGEVPVVAAIPERDAEVQLVLGRHWPRQTLEEMFQVDDPTKLVVEHARPIIGVAHGELLRAIGGTVSTYGCAGTVTMPNCGTNTRDELYVPGFVDDQPLSLYVEAEVRDDPTSPIKAFSINFPAALVETVPAMLRKKFGAPNRVLGGLGALWIRGDRRVEVDVVWTHEGFAHLHVDRVDPKRDPSPRSKLTDATKIRECKTMLEIYDSFMQCARIDVHDRLLHHPPDPATDEASAATCTAFSAELNEMMAAAHCR
jgi:hypothetical protein